MLFRNTMAQSAGFALGYLFSFLLAPLMIDRLGLDAFGVWAVTGAFATYAGLLDLGIGRSLSRFIAVFDAQQDERRIRECVGLGLLVVLLVGVVAAAVAAALAAPLSDNLGVIDAGQMRIVVLCSVAIWTCNGFAGVLNGVGIGKREMVPPNVAIMVGSTVNFAASVAALLSSDALTVYAGANAAAALVAIVPCVFAMRRVWHGPYLARPSCPLVREVIGFGLKTQLAWFADLINLQTDKLIIAFMVDVHAAAVYEIGARVVSAVRSMAIMSVAALIPTAAARVVEEGKGVVHEMYRRYLVRTCATAFPLFMFVAVSSPYLLVAWLGSVPADAGVVVPVLCAAYLVNITTGVGTTLSIGYGEAGLAARNSVMIAVANVLLTLALAPAFGLWGVVAGTAVAIVLGSMAFNRRFLRVFELPMSDFWEGALPPALLAIGLAVPFAALALAVGLPGGRGAALALLAIPTVGYVLPYWLLATRRGLLPERLRFPLRLGKKAAPSSG
jgi:O-antigen/teichoic acid export membrane protein